MSNLKYLIKFETVTKSSYELSLQILLFKSGIRRLTSVFIIYLFCK